MRKVIFLCFILALKVSFSIAQNKIISGKIGYAYNLKKSASGTSFTLEYQHKLKANHFISVGLDNIFTQRRGSLPKEISPKYIIKDYTNPNPYDGFDWTNGFPYYQLPSTPDKYFDFNTAIKYLYQTVNKNSFFYQFGGGVCITYHDEMELVQWINADFKSPFSRPLTDSYFPVFQYDTYLDLGIVYQMEVQKIIKDRITLGISSKFYYFPKSTNSLLTLQGIVGIAF
jgi:hypothetical protein